MSIRRATEALAALSLAAAALAPARPPRAAPGAALFRVVTMQLDLVIGLGTEDLDAMGEGEAVDRIAAHIAATGQVSAWRYMALRGPEGDTRWVAGDRVAILRQDALLIEPLATPLPILPPRG